MKNGIINLIKKFFNNIRFGKPKAPSDTQNKGEKSESNAKSHDNSNSESQQDPNQNSKPHESNQNENSKENEPAQSSGECPVDENCGGSDNAETETTSNASDEANEEDNLQNDSTENSNSGSIKTIHPQENPKPPIDAPSKRITLGPRETSQSSPHNVHPELICREQRVNGWEIVLSIPENRPVEEIKDQSGQKLVLSGNELVLDDYIGKLSIKFSDGRTHAISLINNQNPLIFKLSRNWKGEGREMKQMTKGYFIVMTPNNWQRLQPASVEPSVCANPDFTAHYFFVDPNSDGYGTDGFKENSDLFGESKFELKGETLSDDSDFGELFVRSVPMLEVKEKITWVRVGEENQDGWKGENFCLEVGPDAISSIQKELAKRCGRFYVRVYEDHGNERVTLVDSGQFRYSSELGTILLDGKEYTHEQYRCPYKDGHSSISLRFLDSNKETIKPDNANKCNQIHVDDNGTVTIGPAYENDRTSWILPSKKGHVEIAIQLHRVWWRVIDPESASANWSGIPLNFTQQRFREYARSAAKIQISLGELEAIHVGFNGNYDRKYRSKNSNSESKIVEIQFSDFLDYPQVDNELTSEASLQINLNEDIITIANIEPTISKVKPQDSPQPNLQSLIPEIKCRNRTGKKNGKGFSKCEIESAGMNTRNLNGIPFDRRRKSYHDHNVIKLQGINLNV